MFDLIIKLAVRMRDRCECELVVCSERAGGDRAGSAEMNETTRGGEPF